MRERVAGRVLDVLAAGPNHRPVDEHDFKPEHRVAGLAVLHAAQTTGVGAEVATNRADLVARRIRGVKEPFVGDGLLELRVEDPRLDDRDEVVVIDLEDSIHLREGDRQGAFDPCRTPAQARAGASRDDRNAMLAGEAHELGNLRGLGRERNGERQSGLLIRGLIVAIRLAVDGIRQDPQVGNALRDGVQEGG